MSRIKCIWMSSAAWACLAIAGATAQGHEQPAAAGPEDWSLRLANVFGEGRDIELFVAWKDGRVDDAFAKAPRFNKMCYRVEAKDVLLTEGRLTGTFSIEIPWDGWIPQNRRPLRLEAKLEAAATPAGFDGSYETRELLPAEAGAEKTAGKAAERTPFQKADPEPKTAKGKLTGQRTAAKPADGVCRLTLECEDTVGKTHNMGTARRIGMALAFKDGRGFAARLIPPGSMTDVGMAAAVEKHALQFNGRRLTGTLTGALRHQGAMDKLVRYEFTFQGLVVGGVAGGTLKVTEDGQARSDGCFVGRVSTGAPDPVDALYNLTLHESIPGHNFLNVSFTVRGGEVRGGFATSPNYNNSIHTVDFSGLRLADGKLRGPLAVTIIPDTWIPTDHKPVSCRYELEAAVADGEVSGGFTGQFGGQEVTGTVAGWCDRKPKLVRIAGMTLKVESGAFSRAFLTMRYDGTKLVSSNISNNHDRSVKGKVTEANLDWSDERVRGSLKLEISRGSGGAKGYTCQVDGALVGTVGAGVADTANLEGHRKASTFWVDIRPMTDDPK